MCLGGGFSMYKGFCCSCSFSSLFGKGSSKIRGGLGCAMSDVGVLPQQSAHCLRMDPLYYHAYHIHAPSYFYQILVHIEHCPSNGKKEKDDSHACTKWDYILSPQKSIQGGVDKDGIQARLYGDFATWTVPPSFEHMALLVPTDKFGNVSPPPSYCKM